MKLRRTPLPIQVFRLARIGLHILQGLFTAAMVFPAISHAGRDWLKRRWSAQLLEIFNIAVKVSGDIPSPPPHNVMFVANHISWLDVFALNSVQPVLFVAKSEVRDWPLVGWLAEKTGTLFIERARRHDTGRVATEATQALQQGHCLCFFPEGTTTDGTRLLPFKASLLQPAINAGAAVWPLTVRYPLADGKLNTAIAYWGDVTMLESLKEILKQRELVVELHFISPITTKGLERRDLAHTARQLIAASLHLPQHAPPETLSDLPDAVQ